MVTPILVPALWFWNRQDDPAAPDEVDKVVPALARGAMMLSGAGFALFALIGLISPTTLIGMWVWTLTPLTARLLGGWFALLAVGGILDAVDRVMDGTYPV